MLFNTTIHIRAREIGGMAMALLYLVCAGCVGDSGKGRHKAKSVKVVTKLFGPVYWYVLI